MRVCRRFDGLITEVTLFPNPSREWREAHGLGASSNIGSLLLGGQGFIGVQNRSFKKWRLNDLQPRNFERDSCQLEHSQKKKYKT